MKIELQEVPESNLKKCENQISGSMKIELQEVPKSYSNNTDNNNTEYTVTAGKSSDTERVSKDMETAGKRTGDCSQNNGNAD